MTLIVILIVVALEHFFRTLEGIRDWRWAQSYADWMHRRFGGVAFWTGLVGVLVTLAMPLVPAWLLLSHLAGGTVLLAAVCGVLALLYSLGPKDLNLQIDAYLAALQGTDAAAVNAAAQALAGDEKEIPPPIRARSVMEGVLAAANERLFGAFFWYALTGPIGALLYRFTSELRSPSTSRSLGFMEGAGRLYALLDWAPARLFALGFALGGSLTHAFESWQFRKTLKLYENVNIIKAAGLGALQFDRPGEILPPEEEREWVEEVRSLIGRTFSVWLIVLALMTLSGWLA